MKLFLRMPIKHIQYYQIKDSKENMMQLHQGHLIHLILLVNLDNNNNITIVAIHRSNKDTNGLKTRTQSKDLTGTIKTFNNKFCLSYLECKTKQEEEDHTVIQMLNNMIL